MQHRHLNAERAAGQDLDEPVSPGFASRAFAVGIGGAQGSGKTSLALGLCRLLRDSMRIGVETNGVVTREDAEFLWANEQLQREEPHGLLIVESGGDALADPCGRDRADYTIHVIDVVGGDAALRERGPGITDSDLLVVNKTDLAPFARASLAAMKRDGDIVRQGAPIVFARCRQGLGVDKIASHILVARQAAISARAGHQSRR